MSWLDAVRRWFLPAKEPTPEQLPALSLSERASVHLRGAGLRVALRPLGDDAWAVVATPVTAADLHDEPEGSWIDGVPVAVEGDDRARLDGVTLDFDGARFLVSIDIEVVARETPNPDGRMYLTNRRLCASGVAFFSDPERGPRLARRVLAVPGVRAALFRDNVVTVERARGASWRGIDQEVGAALREHFLSLGSAVVRYAANDRDEALARDVETVIERDLLPMIHRDGGHLELVDVTDGVVQVRLQGACRSCPAAAATLQQGVLVGLRRALGDRVRQVEQVAD
jgi:Fe-S cluster biogenesis protein NfuA